MTDAKRPYHHGDAANALLAAAEDLLESVGAAGLSLRQVAERAGLSRQAPYNHFADKEALLAGLAQRGFERLTAALNKGTAGRSGEVALAAACEAYLSFADSNPSLFRLLFQSELVDIGRFPDAAAAGQKAFAALAKTVASLPSRGGGEDRSLVAWAIVHGYAVLCNETGIEAPERRTERARQFARMIARSPER